MAGIFYPELSRSLADWVDRSVDRRAKRRRWIALVAPHGGDPEGAAVRGALFSRVSSSRSAVILGPNHSGSGKPAAVAPRGVWETPLGRLSVDQRLAKALLSAAEQMEGDEEAHRDEHASEVLLPFLKRICGLRSFVPVAFGKQDRIELGVEQARLLGNGIGQALRDFGEEILLVISTNLSQYEPDAEMEVQDRRLIERMVALDEEGLIEEAGRFKSSMCGLFPAAVGIAAAKNLGASKGILVRYERSSQVGYAGIAIQ